MQRKGFDIVCINACKPKFQLNQSPFFEIDKTSKNKKGRSLSSLDEFSAIVNSGRKQFLEGNATLLTKYFQ